MLLQGNNTAFHDQDINACLSKWYGQCKHAYYRIPCPIKEVLLLFWRHKMTSCLFFTIGQEMLLQLASCAGCKLQGDEQNYVIWVLLLCQVLPQAASNGNPWRHDQQPRCTAATAGVLCQETHLPILFWLACRSLTAVWVWQCWKTHILLLSFGL